MNWFSSALIVLVSGLGLSACSQPAAEFAPVVDPSTERDLSSGSVAGYRDPNGAQVWLGLPFAASTAGDNRWRAPQAEPTWFGVLDALEHAAPCPQPVNAFNGDAPYRTEADWMGSEDCLKLDVYAPEGAGPEMADLPVMMWIHGGSNVWGYASQYDGAQLAADQNVVVVVVQYRLGPLGFFAHPAIDEGQGANFALLDQVAALEWIRDEIDQFGGDRTNVTIFGESAGGHNVAALLASPLAEGLFHRAIIQSGSFDSTPLAEARSGHEMAAVPAASRLIDGEVDAEALRSASLTDLYALYADAMETDQLPRVIADGVSLPADGLLSAFDTLEGFNAVPVISGATRDEMKLFMAFDPMLTQHWFGALIHVRDQDFYDRLSAYQARIWRVLAVDQPLAQMHAVGHEAIWAYRFDWDESGRFLTMDLSDVLGAAHALEIPFVFNHFDFFGPLDAVLFNDRNEEGRLALARSMGAYWAAFARTGDPGAAGGADWPAWSEQPVLMRFDAPQAGAETLIRQGDSLTAIIEDLSRDDDLTPEQVCIIAQAVAQWHPESKPALTAALPCSV